MATLFAQDLSILNNPAVAASADDVDSYGEGEIQVWSGQLSGARGLIGGESVCDKSKKRSLSIQALRSKTTSYHAEHAHLTI